ncbi:MULTISPECIES: hypothetical protein [unclassified Caballeronia]|jgi:hypothetical protein|uniref:hypothetical protein n=1 Tax=unclassified Caballeronia TaxID=2646786 RepID=UPI00285E2AD8|nr:MULTISPECIES: hypothetical protein [unclassified Caballeronia]MDR5754974.1 hypothetical protein [Caballeronia sp. LZ024]MDR5845533.1 hypothetical protein [Caballeronia sp. LZ031]
MSHDFSIEAGLVVFSHDGRAQFGWLDLETGAYYAEADGRCIPDAIGAIEFHSDVTH